MASMLKRLDTFAYHAIASVVEGAYTGENQLLGLSDGSMDFTMEGNNIKVPDAVLKKLQEIREDRWNFLRQSLQDWNSRLENFPAAISRK